jgi:hypothetical protein
MTMGGVVDWLRSRRSLRMHVVGPMSSRWRDRGTSRHGASGIACRPSARASSDRAHADHCRCWPVLRVGAQRCRARAVLRRGRPHHGRELATLRVRAFDPAATITVASSPAHSGCRRSQCGSSAGTPGRLCSRRAALHCGTAPATSSGLGCRPGGPDSRPRRQHVGRCYCRTSRPIRRRACSRGALPPSPDVGGGHGVGSVSRRPRGPGPAGARPARWCPRRGRSAPRAGRPAPPAGP